MSYLSHVGYMLSTGIWQVPDRSIQQVNNDNENPGKGWRTTKPRPDQRGLLEVSLRTVAYVNSSTY